MLCILWVYTINITFILHVYTYTPNISQQPACAFMFHQYILCIYYVYTRHRLIYATDIACTICCFQGFIALIAHPRRRLMARMTTRKPEEAHDEADFCLPYSQAVLDRFMSNISVGHDEQGRFASAHVGEVHFNWYAYHILCKFKYMKCIYTAYTD